MATDKTEEEKKTTKKATTKKTTVKKSVKKTTKKATKKAVKKTTKKAESSKDSGNAGKTKSDELKAKLEEKLKALEAKVGKDKEVDIKGEVKGEKEEKKDALIPVEDYLKSSIHLGTRVITPDMKPYVFRRRADGLAVFNTSLVDDEIKAAADFMSKFAPEQIAIACKREAGWHAVKEFGESLGIKTFTKKYPAGTLTNAKLETFLEADLVIVCDPWIDKNIMKDANQTKVKVLAVCDTNNYTRGVDQILPGNNKSAKSLGMIFHLLGKLYAEKRGMIVDYPPIQEFVEGWDELQPPA